MDTKDDFLAPAPPPLSPVCEGAGHRWAGQNPPAGSRAQLGPLSLGENLGHCDGPEVRRAAMRPPEMGVLPRAISR